MMKSKEEVYILATSRKVGLIPGENKVNQSFLSERKLGREKVTSTRDSPGIVMMLLIVS